MDKMRQHNFHEQFEREEAVTPSSNRSFCIVFGIFSALVGGYKLYRGSHAATVWLGFSLLMLLLAWLKPSLVAPFNRLWAQLGVILARITNPIIIGLLYYSTIVPMGLFARLSGKKLLQLDYDPSAESYWVLRAPPGPAPDTMINQF